MQVNQTFVRLFFLLLPFTAFTQTTYLAQDAREYVLLERLEIKSGRDSVLNFSKIRPFSRKQYLSRLTGHWDTLLTQIKGRHETLQPIEVPAQKPRIFPGITDAASLKNIYQISKYLTNIDAANLVAAFRNNIEWIPDSIADLIQSRHSFLKRFYRTPANFYEVRAPDFFLSVNPVFQYRVGKETDNDQHIFQNSRGITLRGRIAEKIGFSAYVADNQEKDPLYVQQWEEERQAVPGQGFYKEFKRTGYDYFDARGLITFNVARYIDVAFGYDKNFIGNGHRSLFLSDFSNSALFLKLNTRIWKFNYQNLFMELQASERQGADILIPKKYAAMHHLDLAVTRWLNIGLFEGVVFSRPDKFEFGYLNPVIFYRSIEQQNGSFDNALAGLDAKANVARKFQFYTQFLLDEFNLVEMRKGSGWWGNKWGLQLGAKYIDAFTIKNLDLQVETNRVRPFTYSHRDSVANYTHYNQPLAHPLGANFQEWIGIARYQPTGKLFLQAKGIFYSQGRDTGLVSFGSNIFYPNIPPYRKSDYGYNLGAGIATKTAYASLLVSYELKPNFFIELNPVIRKVGATMVSPEQNSFVIYGGIRWNMHRREFDF